MREFNNFWEYISLRIESEYLNGHPSAWKQGTIKAFLRDFKRQIINTCQKDLAKAEVLEIAKQNNSYNYDSWDVISSDAFRSLFIKNTSSGKVQTKNQFAIYFGYDSFEDCIKKNNFKEKTHNKSNMKTNPILENIKSYTQKGELEKAIRKLNAVVNQSSILDNLVVQSKEYDKLMQLIRRGSKYLANTKYSQTDIKIKLMTVLNMLEANLSKIEKEIKEPNINSDLTAKNITAKKDVHVKAKMENSNTYLDGINSKEGNINIDIELN